jgi:hypothetical protein
MQAERGQPDTIHRVRTGSVPIPRKVKRIGKIGSGDWEGGGAGSFIAHVECPCTARNGQVARGSMKGRENRDPRREFIRMVPDYEHAFLKE